MKHLRTIVMAVIAMIAYSTNATAQVETKITQNLTINGGIWTKVLKAGDPVTIFSYKQDGDTHSFGIYSDDYAGEIDMRGIPFNVDSKQLKKLPRNSKKGLKTYTPMACAKARENAFAGKYKTTAPDMFFGTNALEIVVTKNTPITIVGFKTVPDISGITKYYYSVLTKDEAGLCDNSSMYKFVMNNIPLPFLPSTDDPQVKAVIANVKQTIKNRKAAEAKAAQEDFQKRIEEQAAKRKALEEQEFEDLKLMDPAYIEVTGWKMNSAGGIKVNIKFTNCSKLRVKYVYFKGYFLNAVGDKCRNDVGGSTIWQNTGVGPISPLPAERKQYVKYSTIFRFDDPLFYSKNARKFRLSSVTIEYMNGKKTVLSGAELDDRVDYTDY